MSKKKMISFLLKLSSFTETFVAVMVLAAVLISSVSLFLEMGITSGSLISVETFDVFLGHALALVIGIEFIKMLIRHTPGAVIEVLLFAIARQLIVYHTSTFETLIGILAVAGAFIVRKYFFVDQFDIESSEQPKKEKTTTLEK